MILNGREISIGDSIIIPMDISTLATTRSMIRNGIKVRKPIWNAVFNSLVRNAGRMTEIGTASMESYGSSADRLASFEQHSSPLDHLPHHIGPCGARAHNPV